MIRSIHAFAIICLTAALPAYTAQSVHIDLEPSFSPGEPKWAVFGEIDTRSFSLEIGYLADNQLGHVFVRNDKDDGFDEYIILADPANVKQYLTAAVSRSFVSGGMRLIADGRYAIRIKPISITLSSFDHRTDGQKMCLTVFQIELLEPGGGVMVSAEVENRGYAQFDEDDDDGYAELVDKTVYGALTKIIGSSVLLTDKGLGYGKIIKTDRGKYAFAPARMVDSVMADAQPDTSDFYDVPLPLSSSDTAAYAADSADRGIRQAIEREKELASFHGGSRVPVGILPFENATGGEKLAPVVKDIQSAIQSLWTRAYSVSIVERERLTDILNEQALGLSGIMDDSTAAQVGRIVGLKAMVAGRVSRSGGYYRISARVINVETGTVVAAVEKKAADGNQIAESIDELAAELLHTFTEEKMAVNRNTMPYSSVAPFSIPAVTASTEDAWGVEYNPAALMKTGQRDAAFYAAFFDHVKGRTGAADGPELEKFQPPYANIGFNLAVPIRTLFAAGLGIRHGYLFPKLEREDGVNLIRAEEAVITVPLAIGITPNISAGVAFKTHILEFALSGDDVRYSEGSALYLQPTAGALVKISQKLKLGLMADFGSAVSRAEEKTSSSGEYVPVDFSIPAGIRIGTAMYPLKWLFFFADLEYRKYPDYPQLQPGFHLGLQLNHAGRIFNIPFTPQFAMLPFFIGYSHEPYDRRFNTQQKYLSMGLGYCVNNIYANLSTRFNVQGKEDRVLPVGFAGNYVKVYDYTEWTPVFVCVGYRF